MPKGGLEPPQGCPHQLLKLARLPFRHFGAGKAFYHRREGWQTINGAALRAMKRGLHAAFGSGTIGAIVRAKEARRPAGNKLPCACSTDVRGVALNMSPQEITKTFTAMLAPDNQRVASYLWLTHRLWNHQLEFVVSEYLHLRSRKENKYAAAI